MTAAPPAMIASTPMMPPMTSGVLALVSSEPASAGVSTSGASPSVHCNSPSVLAVGVVMESH